MTIRKIVQTFGMDGSRHLLDKLDWEIKELEATSPHNPERLSYVAFNAVVTAWHLPDWIWEDMTEAQRRTAGFNAFADLQAFGRNSCRAVFLCRQVATASKHRVVSTHFAREVDATVSASDTLNMISTSELLACDLPDHTPKFIDGTRRIPAASVFREVHGFWGEFMDRHGIDL